MQWPFAVGAPPVHHARRGRGRHWAAVMVVLLGAVAIGSGGLYLVRQGPGGVGACAPPALRIIAAPDIAPLVRTAAKVTTRARCPSIAVASQEPAETVRGVRAHPPDVWIPSTTAWLRIASPDGNGYPSVGTSLARSPLVVAAPRPLAQSMGWPAKQPTWTDLANLTYAGRIPKFSMADPLKATSGLLAVLGVEVAIARTGAGAGGARLKALTFRSRLADASADPGRLLHKVAGVADPVRDIGVFPVTEQGLWASLTSTGSSGMVALYPSDGLIEADYPLVMSSRLERDAARRPLVDRLISWFRGDAGARALVDRGFRPPSGAKSDAMPAAEGLLRQYGQATTLPPDPGAVADAATVWSHYQELKFQVLLLVDASASMNDPARDSSGHLTTKAALLRQSAGAAVQLFGQNTSAGMWQFPSPRANGLPYSEVVPFGPLAEQVGGVSRRDALGRALGDYRALPRTGSALYDTVLSGQATMRQRSRPNVVTLVFVITDGRDGGTISRASFLSHLTADVPIYGLGYGIGADMTVLRAAAQATGGQALAVTSPRDLDSAVASMFLAAHRAGSGS